MNVHEKVQWVYQSKNNQDLAERYDAWSAEYEHDLEDLSGYVGPQRTVEVLTQYLPYTAKILDAGVGTGLVGKALHAQGFTHLEGIDLSEGMLKKAAEKGIYQALYRRVMGDPLGFLDNSYDGIISVGVFTYGHAPSKTFEELIRITKPDGYIIFPLRPEFYESSDFKAKMLDLEVSGKWQLVSQSNKIQPLPQLSPELDYQIWVYQVNK
ncbi:class I SAM-dependent DNA methyltransferase [Adonisia turfae]|nr:class I SAM-dependent methyltransferase [Adonisia turfae]